MTGFYSVCCTDVDNYNKLLVSGNCSRRVPDKKTTIFTLCIWTDWTPNCVDPDQTQQDTVSDQDLHCLPHS